MICGVEDGLGEVRPDVDACKWSQVREIMRPQLGRSPRMQERRQIGRKLERKTCPHNLTSDGLKKQSGRPPSLELFTGTVNSTFQHQKVESQAGSKGGDVPWQCCESGW